MQRSSGVLLHPSSLPGPFGIGDLGPSAEAFVHRLAEAGQSIWQVLPLGPTGYGDSPYAPFSTFAGNDLLVSPELLAREGLLDKAEIVPPEPFPEDRVDYGRVIAWKRPLLDMAARRFLRDAAPARRADFEAFRRREASWLQDYALFMAVKADYDERARREGRDGARWNNYWPRSLALREPSALEAERGQRAEAALRIEALQFFFDEEWSALKAKANIAGIRVMGDLPIYVAEDSADVWTNRGLFLLDSTGMPTLVAGVPPDYFSEDGQLWGNPLYDWEAHRSEGFAWWRRRIEAALSRYDYVRVDHFRGFEAGWAVPAGETTARKGTWRPAPGRELLAALMKDLGSEIPIVAEDLGFITPEVRALRDDFGLPGMRILQFAFDAGESGAAFDPGNAFLPHNYVERCVAYTGTHDNATLRGWLAGATDAELDYLDEYLGRRRAARPEGAAEGNAAVAGRVPAAKAAAAHADDPARAEALLREAWKSVAAWAVAPLQDILGLGPETRMNTPSTLGGNWAWRLREGGFDAAAASRLARLSRLYGRNL